MAICAHKKGECLERGAYASTRRPFTPAMSDTSLLLLNFRLNSVASQDYAAISYNPDDAVQEAVLMDLVAQPQRQTTAV